jgi:hypothetical protein
MANDFSICLRPSPTKPAKLFAASKSLFLSSEVSFVNFNRPTVVMPVVHNDISSIRHTTAQEQP